MATKKEIIEYIFKECEKNGNYVFNNNYVKNVLQKLNSSTNPYDIVPKSIKSIKSYTKE